MMRLFLIILGTTFLVVSCSNEKQENVTLSATTSSALAKGSVNDVIIEEAKILVTRIKLKADDAEDMNIESGPMVVDLNLEGNIQTVAAAEIPAGTYSLVKFEIHLPEVGESVPDPDFKTGESGNERFSVVVKGIYNSNDFVYRSRMVANQLIMIDPPVVIADSLGTANVTLLVNATTWFDGPSEGTLDPNDTSAVNRAAIDNNIRASFRAFRDLNKDGDDSN